MDTRFWGPSGWKLLHLIAAEPGDTAVYEWFKLLPFVLPCKYCRASLQEYYEKKPLTLEIVRSNFGRWLYEIHNLVNAKLRDQGILKTADPSWPSVRDYYKKLRAGLCDKSPIIGWDFFASIAYTTPTKGIASKPMANTPESPNMTIEVRNRYNLLTPKERIAILRKWWHLLPEVLPCSAWKDAWQCSKSKEPPLNRGRGPVSCWLWAIEEAACKSLQCPTPHASLPALKSEMSAFESACGSSKKKKTCRAKRKALRKAAMTRRAQNGGGVF